MVNKTDLHDEFINELGKRFPKKIDLVNYLQDTLKFEKENIYRRLSGKVNFSVREMGIIAKSLDMSVDSIMYKRENIQWLPFMLESPLKIHSMDMLADIVDHNFSRLQHMTRDEPGESGNIYSSLPLEFFVSCPMIMKFMFFKWGNYFVRSDEYSNFSEWELPERISSIMARHSDIYNFHKSFYIWDSSMIWTLVREIDTFHKMNIITAEEKEGIKEELKELLSRLEKILNGTYTPAIPLSTEMDFYVSSMHVGLTSCYYHAGDKHLAMLQTNFSFSKIENSSEGFEKIKEWIESFRDISTLLSRSGRVERRLFFDTQYKTIDQIL